MSEKNIEECRNYTPWLIITITISEPVIELVIEPLSEPISEPVSESISEPVSEPICEHEWKFSMLESDWLIPNHPILKAKFGLITVLLNRSTYHKCQDLPTNLSPNIMGTPHQ